MELEIPPPERRGTTSLPDGRALGWSEWGTGAPVLFFPGAATTSRLGLAAGAVEAAGVRLVALDRPGLGASDPAPDRTLQSWAEDVRAFVAARGLGRPRLLASSQGAPFALACATAGVVSSVAITSGADELAHPPVFAALPAELRALVSRAAAEPAATEAMFASMTAETFLGMVLAMSTPEDRAIYTAPSFDGAFRAALAEAFARGAQGYARDTWLAMRSWGLDLGRIAGPVTLWYGARDTSPVHSLDHGATLAARIPGARRIVVEDAGGALVWTRSAEILRALVSG